MGTETPGVCHPRLSLLSACPLQQNALPSADEIASQLHTSKDMAVKQIAELNRRGLLDQHMVPMLESNGKNFFSLPNELFS